LEILCEIRLLARVTPQHLVVSGILETSPFQLREGHDQNCHLPLVPSKYDHFTLVMSDPRDHPLFWEMRSLLQGTIGPKVTLKNLIPLMQEIAADNDLRIPRNATRRKDNAIRWMCENIQYTRSVLSPAIQDSAEQSSVEARVQKNWVMIPTVRGWLEVKFGRHPRRDDLTRMAIRLAATLHILLDRQAKRNINALECWFAENWTAISRVDSPDSPLDIHDGFADQWRFDDDFGFDGDGILDTL
jgi:hypothetical protein